MRACVLPRRFLGWTVLLAGLLAAPATAPPDQTASADVGGNRQLELVASERAASLLSRKTASHAVVGHRFERDRTVGPRRSAASSLPSSGLDDGSDAQDSMETRHGTCVAPMLAPSIVLVGLLPPHAIVDVSDAHARVILRTSRQVSRAPPAIG